MTDRSSTQDLPNGIVGNLSIGFAKPFMEDLTGDRCTDETDASSPSEIEILRKMALVKQ
jgi:hypothetical protein